MATFIDSSSQWRLKAESTYGTAVSMTSADVVELINPTMDASTDLIDREILRNSLVKAQPLLGKETSSGSAGVEISTVTGTIGVDETINGDILYKAGMGHRISGTAAESTTVDTATGVITCADSSVYSVGQAVKLSGGATDEFAVIRTIVDGTSFTVLPLPSDATNVVVQGMLSYTVARPDEATISMTVEEYFKNAVDYVTYLYTGVVVTDMTIDFPLGNIVKTSFNLAGAGFTVSSGAVAGDDRATICHGLSPYVSKNMTFSYAGTNYAIESLSVNIASDIYDTEALTTAGLTNKTVTGKSNVGGSFGLEFEGTALFDSFKAGTSGMLYGTVSNASSTMGVFAPKVIISKSSKSTDSGIYKDSADFTCLSSDTCSPDVEDAITIFVS